MIFRNDTYVAKVTWLVVLLAWRWSIINLDSHKLAGCSSISGYSFKFCHTHTPLELVSVSSSFMERKGTGVWIGLDRIADCGTGSVGERLVIIYGGRGIW